ncbi:MAG: hypothetical protein Q9209_004156 [Squamulea sp. 1 TL-2023]
MVSLIHVRTSPTVSARTDASSIFSSRLLTLDTGLIEPSPKTNMTVEDPPDCNTQPHDAGTPRYFPVNRDHCVELVFRLVIKPRSTQAVLWDPNTIVFPLRFYIGTCTVSVYAGATGAADVFPLIAVARIAGLIINQCATPDKGYLGGRLEIGPRKVFWVSVTGTLR